MTALLNRMLHHSTCPSLYPTYDALVGIENPLVLLVLALKTLVASSPSQPPPRLVKKRRWTTERTTLGSGPAGPRRRRVRGRGQQPQRRKARLVGA